MNLAECFEYPVFAKFFEKTSFGGVPLRPITDNSWVAAGIYFLAKRYNPNFLAFKFRCVEITTEQLWQSLFILNKVINNSTNHFNLYPTIGTAWRNMGGVHQYANATKVYLCR